MASLATRMMLSMLLVCGFMVSNSHADCLTCLNGINPGTVAMNTDLCNCACGLGPSTCTSTAARNSIVELQCPLPTCSGGTSTTGGSVSTGGSTSSSSGSSTGAGSNANTGATSRPGICPYLNPDPADLINCPAHSPCGMADGSLCPARDYNWLDSAITESGSCSSGHVISCDDGSQYTISIKYAQGSNCYNAKIEAVSTSTGQVMYSRIYNRKDAKEDGCACLCAILLPATPSGCRCLYNGQPI